MWRIAGCADYFSKYEFGYHIAITSMTRDAIAAVQLANTEAEQLAGRTLARQVTDPNSGEIRPITLVTAMVRPSAPPGSSGS